MARVLTKLRIDEVSAVDRAAGEGTKIVLMKRAPADEPHAASRRAYFLKIFTKADDGADDAGDITNHPVVQMARLLVASGKFGDHGQALDYLLNKPNGQALLARMRKAAEPAKETSMTSHSEFVQSVVKQYGIVALAKSMVKDQKAYGLDEHTFTRLATEHAQRVYPNDRSDVAFGKLFESEESVRRACNIAKAAPLVADLTPLQVGGADAMREANDDTEASEAYRQLAALGQQRWPNERSDVQFSRAFGLRPDLAAKAHRRPSATTSFEFPR